MMEEFGTKYDHWMKELRAEDKAHGKWRERAKKVVDRYRNEQMKEGSHFNILWSNTKVLHAATLSARPKPDVTRRFKDPDQVSAQIAETIERALSYSVDVYDFDGQASMTDLDYLLTGLGQNRVRYIPYFEKGEPPKIPLMTQEMMSEDEEGNATIEIAYMNGEDRVDEPMFDELGIAYMLGEPEDELVYEEVTCENVPWSRFRWQPSSSWESCNWAAIEHYLSKEELEEQFGEKAMAVPLGYSSDGKKASSEEDGKDRARVYEIFDRRERKVIVIAEGCREVLEEQDDPLGLEGFYPFPRPMLSNIVSDDTTPMPDFLLYQDQALELDEITRRIDALTREIKWRGIYDGSFKQLGNLSGLDDGEFEPVDQWSERFPDGRRLEDAIYQMPLSDLMGVLGSLYQAREGIKQTIYEITGISDIVRGATKATETLGAQQLKQQNAGLRLTEKQNEVNRFFRDLFRIKAEVIAEHFSAETLSLMTGVQVTPEMMDTMKSDMLRTYSIDIETDSTVASDQVAEQQNVTQLLGAMTQFLTSAMPLAQAGVPLEAIKEMLLFAIRRFKGGRQLEQVINKYMPQATMQPQMPQMPMGGMNAGNGAIAVNSAMGGIPPQM